MVFTIEEMRPVRDEAIGRFTSNMVVMLTDISDGVNAE